MIAAGLWFIRLVVIPAIILLFGQEVYDNWTYEERVETCINQVKTLTTVPGFIKEAEINCRKTLK